MNSVKIRTINTPLMQNKKSNFLKKNIYTHRNDSF